MVFIVATILGLLLFFYSRLTLISAAIQFEGCLLYSQFAFRGFNKLLVPLVLWAIIVQIVPWVLDIVACIQIIRQLKRISAERRRLQEHTTEQGVTLITSRDLKVTWIIVCHCICNLAACLPEISYILFLTFDWQQSKEFNMVIYLTAVFFPSFRLLLSLPFTMQGFWQSNVRVMERFRKRFGIFTETTTS